MNLTLVGMSGAGKSFVGSHLAERLGLEFVDSDVLLSRAFKGRKIQELLEELGEDEYVRTEGDIHMRYTDGRDNMLLSPAGSVIYNDEWMRHLQDISKVIYLKVPYEIIEQRNQRSEPRAIIGLGPKTLRQLYDERSPIYERAAHFTVETAEYDLEGVLCEIGRFLNSQKLKSYFPDGPDYYSSSF